MLIHLCTRTTLPTHNKWKVIVICAVPETDTHLNTLCKRPIISRLKNMEWLSCHVEVTLKRSYRNCHLLAQPHVFLNPYYFLWIWEAAMTSVMKSGPFHDHYKPFSDPLPWPAGLAFCLVLTKQLSQRTLGI